MSLMFIPMSIITTTMIISFVLKIHKDNDDADQHDDNDTCNDDYDDINHHNDNDYINEFMVVYSRYCDQTRSYFNS